MFIRREDPVIARGAVQPAKGASAAHRVKPFSELRIQALPQEWITPCRQTVRRCGRCIVVSTGRIYDYANQRGVRALLGERVGDHQNLDARSPAVTRARFDTNTEPRHARCSSRPHNDLL